MKEDRIIDGKYRIIQQIGEGGMSRVYLAMDTHLNKAWAVKEIKQGDDARANAIVADSLEREADLMRSFDHPALPRIVDIIDEDGSLYVVMDYIEGETLSSVSAKHGPQPQDTVMDWGCQLCEVLDYLHTRTPPIIYRDMKPSNVMLKPDGSLCIIDFGIARFYRSEESAGRDAAPDDTTILGTRGYAAPEQFGGAGQTDARTDVYCLGATLYHVATGLSPAEPPYTILPLRQVDPAFSPGFDAIIAKATQASPDDRYQSCAEMYYALRNSNTADDAYRKKQRNLMSGFVALGVTTLALALIGVGLLAAGWKALNDDYDYQMTTAEHQGSQTEAADSYLRAIALRPEITPAYEGLLGSYQQDLRFTTDEESQYRSVIVSNVAALQAKDANAYAQLAFDTGRLYWYYYDYGSDAGDNRSVRIVASERWMADAAATPGFEQQEEAQVYSDIARFHSQIVPLIDSGADAGMYAPYLDSLEQLIAIAGESDNDVMRMQAAGLSYDAVEAYARKFRADGVEKQRLEALITSADALLAASHPTTPSLDEQMQNLSRRQQRIQTSLDLSYTDIPGGADHV